MLRTDVRSAREPWQSLALELLRGVAREASASQRAPRPLHAKASAAQVSRLRDLKIDSLYYLASGSDAPVQSLYDSLWNAQANVCAEVLAAMEDASVPTIIFKGAEFLHRYWSSAVAWMSDIDILVPRDHLGMARAVLYRMGFRQAKFSRPHGVLVDADVIELSEVEGRHYELFPFCRLDPIELTGAEIRLARKREELPLFIDDDGRAFVIAEVDLHHKVTLDVDTEPFFERCRASTFGAGWSMSAADHLWFTTSRLYNEVAIHGKRSLRDFAFLLSLVTLDDIEWNVVLDSARQYHLHASLYYYFSFLASLSGKAPPQDVVDALVPLATSRLRDWGWQLATLFDVLDASPIDLSRAGARR
jgi:hypothetical protein